MGAPFYFYFFVILSVVQSFSLSPMMGFYYTCFGLTCLLSFNLYKWNSFYRTPLMFIHLAFYLTYYVRPFLLWDRPEFFEFIDVTHASHDAIMYAVRDVTQAFFFIVLGFVLVTKLVAFEKKIHIKVSRRYLQEHFTMLSIFGIFLAVLKVFLFFVLGIGAKGVAITSPLAFIQRFIPEDLFFIVTIIALLVLKDELTYFQKIMIASVSGILAFGIMITGSKIFIMRLGFFYIAYMVHYQKTVPIMKFVILVSTAMTLVTASFVMSSTMKYFNKSGKELTPVSLATVGWERYNLLDGAEVQDMLTERMNGMDGQIVTTKIIMYPGKKKINELKACFSAIEVFRRIVEGIVPGIKVSTTPSAGVAVSWYIYEFDRDFIFAGAVGFCAAMQWGSDPSFLNWAQFIYGAVLALIFGAIKWIKLDLLQYGLMALIVFHIVMVTISGNFDVIFSQLFIKLVLIPCYGLMFLFIRQFFKYR